MLFLPFHLQQPGPAPQAIPSDWDRAASELDAKFKQRRGAGLVISIQRPTADLLVIRYLEPKASSSEWRLVMTPVDSVTGEALRGMTDERTNGFKPHNLNVIERKLAVTPQVLKMAFKYLAKQYGKLVGDIPLPPIGAAPKVFILYKAEPLG